jgi:hypothetical protein
VRKKFEDLQQREVALVAEEARVASLRDEVKRRTDLAIQEHEDASKRKTAEAQHSLRLERDKGRHIEEKMAEVEAELARARQRFKDLEAEVDDRRKLLDNLPVSKLQQELQNLQLHLRDTERRNEALAASRDHLKSKVEELCRRFLHQASTPTTPVAISALPAEGLVSQNASDSADKAPEHGMAEMMQALRKMQDHLGELSREWSVSPPGGPATVTAMPVSVPDWHAAAPSNFMAGWAPAPAFDNASHSDSPWQQPEVRDSARHLAWLQGQREELLQSGLYSEGDPVLRAIDARISEALSRAGGIRS